MRLLVSSLLLSVSASAFALAPGDLIATGLHTDADESVSLLALVDIPTGTQLFFTDNGWQFDGSGVESFRPNEGSKSWTSDGPIAAASEVHVNFDAATVAVDGVVSATAIVGEGGSLNLSSSGDTILVYTGSNDTPEFVTGITIEGWVSPGTTLNSNTSSIPSILEGTGFAVDPTFTGTNSPERDNVRFQCSQTTSGTVEELVASINTIGAFETNNSALDPAGPPGCTWVIESECDDVCDPDEACPDDCFILDTFASSFNGWTVGNGGAGTGLTNPLGGLGGDGYLSTTATGGSGPGSKLVVFNDDQWLGNWTSNGRTSVYFHARASEDLTLRLIVETGPGQTQDAITTDSVELLADGEWHIIEFSVTAADLTILGDTAAEDILTDVSKLRIVHADSTSGATAIAATLDLDNVSTAPLAAECGDSAINNDEVCDGLAVGLADCTDEGFTGAGDVTCDDVCGAIVYDTCESDCGDSNVEPGEDCDDGGLDTALCDADCTDVAPDDGICNAEAGETPLTAPNDCADVCGDGLASGDEECDGDDLNNGACTDLGYAAGGTLGCSDSCLFDDAACVAECGNGVAEPGEACDDGEVTANCTAACTIPECGDTECNGLAGEDAASCSDDCPDSCGDGLVTGLEQCDGAELGGQSCIDFGYATAGALSCDDTTCEFDAVTGCSAVCGNAALEPGEECDDANTALDDGCSDVCAIEEGWDCNEADGCVEDCGDGFVIGEEECDDENTDLDDGCDDGCLVEDFFVCDDGEPSLCLSDVDEDGVADDEDNCPDDANPGQEDADNNDIGDACEDVDPDTDPDTDTDPDPDTDTDPDPDTDTDLDLDPDTDDSNATARCGCQVSPWNLSLIHI